MNLDFSKEIRNHYSSSDTHNKTPSPKPLCHATGLRTMRGTSRVPERRGREVRISLCRPVCVLLLGSAKHSVG